MRRNKSYYPVKNGLATEQQHTPIVIYGALPHWLLVIAYEPMKKGNLKLPFIYCQPQPAQEISSKP
jgi:hypothetical protein